MKPQERCKSPRGNVLQEVSNVLQSIHVRTQYSLRSTKIARKAVLAVQQ